MSIKYVKLKKGCFHQIKISPEFAASKPCPERIIEKMLLFHRECYLAPIIVDSDFVLVDGYCSYLIAKQVGTDFVKIKMARIEE